MKSYLREIGKVRFPKSRDLKTAMFSFRWPNEMAHCPEGWDTAILDMLTPLKPSGLCFVDIGAIYIDKEGMFPRRGVFTPTRPAGSTPDELNNFVGTVVIAPEAWCVKAYVGDYACYPDKDGLCGNIGTAHMHDVCLSPETAYAVNSFAAMEQLYVSPGRGVRIIKIAIPGLDFYSRQ